LNEWIFDDIELREWEDSCYKIWNACSMNKWMMDGNELKMKW